LGSKLLSPAERAQTQRLRSAQQANRWAFSHAAMRSILARHLNQPPESIEYAFGPSGKPALRSHPPSRSATAFSLTHSGDHAWLAVSDCGPVGLDLEQMVSGFDWAGLVDHVCSSAEKAALFGHPPEAQRGAFYRLWVRKEAMLKGLGSGLGLDRPLNGLEVLASTVDTPERWSVLDLPAPEGYAAALATTHPDTVPIWNEFTDLPERMA